MTTLPRAERDRIKAEVARYREMITAAAIRRRQRELAPRKKRPPPSPAMRKMWKAIGEQHHRRAIIDKTLRIDPLLNSGNSYAWHVWLWWLNSFKLIEQARLS